TVDFPGSNRAREERSRHSSVTSRSISARIDSSLMLVDDCTQILQRCAHRPHFDTEPRAQLLGAKASVQRSSRELPKRGGGDSLDEGGPQSERARGAAREFDAGHEIRACHVPDTW